jgi:Mg2+/Co2+ transporter CorB
MRIVDVALLGVAAVLFVVVGYLALAETALTQMSLVKALALKHERRRRARRLVRLVENRERWLTPLLFAMLLFNFVGRRSSASSSTGTSVRWASSSSPRVR